MSSEDLLSRLQAAGSVKETAPSAGSSIEKELEKTDSDFKTPLSLRNLFTHHDAHPVVINFALLKSFNLEWYHWEPETIWSSIHSLFESKVSEHNRAKIRAIQCLNTSHAPWEMWQVFEKVIQALNNNIPHFGVMQAPSLDQLYAGVDIMDTLRRETFSQEVKSYMAAAVLNEDVFYVPEPLDFLQVDVSQPHYRCRDCNQSYSAISHDGVCDTCTEKFDPEQGLSMRPKPELLQAGYGKSMDLFLKYDPDLTQKRWEEVRGQKSGDVDFGDTQADAQIAKLLVARDYLNIRRRQLSEQLTSLKSWLGSGE